MHKLTFACGAGYDLKAGQEPMRDKKGNLSRYLVYVAGGNTKQPQINGKPANCVFNCPASAGSSGRKMLRAWVGKTEADVADCSNREPVLCVSCKPIAFE